MDDGTFRKFGTEIEFRGQFEKTIAREMTNADSAASATNVPVVCIVVEGGPGTLVTVRAAIDNHTPVVVLDVSFYKISCILLRFSAQSVENVKIDLNVF